MQESRIDEALFEVLFDDQTLLTDGRETLRQVLLRSGLTPHNGQAKWLNCKGMGTCGTCAVAIEGAITPPTKIENWRLGFPPHQRNSGLRLACQVRCKGNVVVTKHPGFWGEEVS